MIIRFQDRLDAEAMSRVTAALDGGFAAMDRRRVLLDGQVSEGRMRGVSRAAGTVVHCEVSVPGDVELMRDGHIYGKHEDGKWRRIGGFAE